jgi:hypothetical protein
MKAYLRIDPLIDERKSHYMPAQLGAFVKVLALSSRQGQRGRFRSIKALTGALPAAYGKHVAFLIEQGDLIEQPDGSLYFDGYDEWQEGDVTVGERMARLRNRKRNNGVTSDAAEPSPTATRSSVGVGVSTDAERGSDEPLSLRARAIDDDGPDDDVTRLQKLAESLTGTPYGFPRHGGMGEKVGVLLRKHGLPAVEAEWRRIAAEERGMPTVRQLVLGADNALNRISTPVTAGKRDEVAEFVARVRAEVPSA